MSLESALAISTDYLGRGNTLFEMANAKLSVSLQQLKSMSAPHMTSPLLLTELLKRNPWAMIAIKLHDGALQEISCRMKLFPGKVDRNEMEDCAACTRNS